MMDTVTITQRHLPPELRGLPCIRAEVAHVIAPGKATPSLEGPIFDRHGNFYCCLTAPNDTYVKKISLDGSISDFFHSADQKFSCFRLIGTDRSLENSSLRNDVCCSSTCKLSDCKHTGMCRITFSCDQFLQCKMDMNSEVDRVNSYMWISTMGSFSMDGDLKSIYRIHHCILIIVHKKSNRHFSR